MVEVCVINLVQQRVSVRVKNVAVEVSSHNVVMVIEHVIFCQIQTTSPDNCWLVPCYTSLFGGHGSQIFIKYFELTKLFGNISIVSVENYEALEFNQPKS